MNKLLSGTAKTLGMGLLVCLLLVSAAAAGDRLLTPNQLKKLQFEAEVGKLVCKFKVEGMHCLGCENMVKETLLSSAGVFAAKANHEKDFATALVDPANADVQAIAKAIEDKTGYKTTFVGWGNP